VKVYVWARPVTSCPAAMSSGMMYEPKWPVPPVTKTRMLLLLVNDAPEEMAVRVRSADRRDHEPCGHARDRADPDPASRTPPSRPRPREDFQWTSAPSARSKPAPFCARPISRMPVHSRTDAI
jgi:hypothetical protein